LTENVLKPSNSDTDSRMGKPGAGELASSGTVSIWEGKRVLWVDGGPQHH
jgi:hypothetical protein